jgi:hypothetical protein
MGAPNEGPKKRKADKLTPGPGEKLRVTVNLGGGETPIRRVAMTRAELIEVVDDLEERTAGLHTTVTLTMAEQVGGMPTSIFPVSSIADVRALLDGSISC